MGEEKPMGSRERDRELLIVVGDEGVAADGGASSAGTGVSHSAGSPASFHHHDLHRKSGGEVSYVCVFFFEGVWDFGTFRLSWMDLLCWELRNWEICCYL